MRAGRAACRAEQAILRGEVCSWTEPARRLLCVTVVELPSAVLVPLLDLADVRPALDGAREAIDGALRHRALRRSGDRVAAEVSLRSAVASAALEGHRYELDEVRGGTVTDPVLQGAVRVAREVDGMAQLWPKVPRQVLARIHVLAGRDVVDAGMLGRPVGPEVLPRLTNLFGIVTGHTGEVPALLLAAIVHGELLALRPFAGPSGVVARAAARVTLVSAGVDPRGVLAPEVGHLAREPEYVGAAGAYATGTPDGVRAWVKHYAAAVELAAAEVGSIAEQVG
jgi:hypothetical protein